MRAMSSALVHVPQFDAQMVAVDLYTFELKNGATHALLQRADPDYIWRH
jgi:hypothetical protein